MKTGRNLQEVLVELDRQNKAKQDFISPAQGMRLREDGRTFEINHLTTNQQEVFGTTSLFHRQVASALGIPAKYYDLMQAQKPELLAENVNSWFADKSSSYMVRSMDYGAGQVARALLSERYALIGILLSSSEQMCKDVGRLSEDQWEAVNAADRDAENGVQPTRKLEALRSTCRVAILYALGYLYEHRDEADHKQLMLTLRSILFAVREGVF